MLSAHGDAKLLGGIGRDPPSVSLMRRPWSRLGRLAPTLASIVLGSRALAASIPAIPSARPAASPMAMSDFRQPIKRIHGWRVKPAGSSISIRYYGSRFRCGY
jgi:hypothetical protein